MKCVECEEGSATVLAVAVIGLIVFLGLTLAVVLGAVSMRIQTETAADAAALAAVAASVDGLAPEATAAGVAAANGARLLRCRCPDFTGRSFTVTVVVTGVIHLPALGERRIDVERSAEYVMGP